MMNFVISLSKNDVSLLTITNDDKLHNFEAHLNFCSVRIYFGRISKLKFVMINKRLGF